MNIEQIKLQYQRLERHYKGALELRDQVSFLDLSHALRVWTEMKMAIDEIANDKGIDLGLKNLVREKETKNILKGSKYVYLPLASGVASPGIQVKGLSFINRVLSPEERKKLYEAGPPLALPTSLTFSQWLASGIYDVPSTNEAHPKLTISREILIKRVANILGASHPQGTDYSDENENRFDPYVRELHQITVADGYPATYYQLLEIAQDILQGVKVLL
jgi:hypothetical protein